MRLQKIIKPQFKEDDNFNEILTTTTSIFWETLIKNQHVPLSESKLNESNKSLEQMIFQTSLFLDSQQFEIFFDTLLNPNFNNLNENVRELLKNTGEKILSGAANLQDKIDNGKKTIAVGVGSGLKKAYSYGSHFFDKYVPESVKKLGAKIIEKVKLAVGVLIEKSEEALKKIAEKLKSLGSADPCRNNLTEDCHNDIFNEYLLKENDQNYLFFRGKNAAILNGVKNFTRLHSVKDNDAQLVATAIAMVKQSGEKVYGADLRSIIHDLHLWNKNKNKANEILNSSEEMNKWFSKNSMKEKIDKIFDEIQTSSRTEICDLNPSFLKTYFGPGSEFYKICEKLGLNNAAVRGIVGELAKNNRSVFTTLANVILSCAMGVGAVKIVGLIFASVIPLIISARISDLENNGAPMQQIEFWKKAKSISKFITTIMQLFSISALMSGGWAAYASDNVSVDNIKNLNIDVLGSDVGGAGHVFNDLPQTSKQMIGYWVSDKTAGEMPKETIIKFLNNNLPKMTNEQYNAFNDLLSKGIDHDKEYNELLSIIKNPTNNGVIDIDMTASKLHAIKIPTEELASFDVDKTINTVKSLNIPNDEKYLLFDKIKSSKLFALKLTELSSDNLKALEDLSPEQMKSYLSTIDNNFKGFDYGKLSVLTPEQISNLEISDPANATRLLRLVSNQADAMNLNLSSDRILNALKKTGFDLNNPKIGLADINVIKQGDKFFDIVAFEKYNNTVIAAAIGKAKAMAVENGEHFAEFEYDEIKKKITRIQNPIGFDTPHGI